MSSETEALNPDKTRTLRPRLRFSEFRAEAWEYKPLRQLATFVNDRVGESKCTPYTITSGIGLVSQQEKLGRSIAGNSFKNYVRLQKNDFAYNKSATKTFPQGYIARYLGSEQAAVPNSIFTCFRPDENEVDPAYLDYLFASNLHGRWLRKFVSVGARAHGALNVDPDDLMSLPVPLPCGKSSIEEQKKIADCLSSTDELIAAQNQKLDILKEHEKGLMQQLFPAKGQTAPRLRLPEFQDAEDWRSDLLGNIFETTSGGTPDRSRKEYWSGTIPWITTSLVDFGVIRESGEFINERGLEHSSAKVFPKGTLLIAMYGQGKTRGKVAMLGIEAATNQACAAILPKKGIDPAFVFLNLSNRYDEMRELSNSGGQENLSQGLIRELPFSFPHDIEEQRKIANRLCSIRELITAQGKKNSELKAHKKGLMQKLFAINETHL